MLPIVIADQVQEATRHAAQILVRQGVERPTLRDARPIIDQLLRGRLTVNEWSRWRTYVTQNESKAQKRALGGRGARRRWSRECPDSD